VLVARTYNRFDPTVRWALVRQHRKRSRHVVRDSYSYWYQYRRQVTCRRPSLDSVSPTHLAVEALARLSYRRFKIWS